MIGQELGHYRIQAKIGQGGMGVVYRARDQRLGREVALKVLPAETSQNEAARTRLLREARTASALNHPNICTIYEVGEFEGRLYIATEYIEGDALSTPVRGSGLPNETLISYGAAIAEALVHAHARGVVHRDLKSSNVMVTPDGRVKLLDFGLARRHTAPQASESTGSTVTVTQAGAVAGTLHYMAPETLRGEAPGARSDLWSLGVLWYEMAVGFLPFTGNTAFEVTSAILRDPPARLPASVPEGLVAVIERVPRQGPCCSFPAGRGGSRRSAGHMRRAGAPTPPSPSARTLDSPRPDPRHRGVAAGQSLGRSLARVLGRWHHRAVADRPGPDRLAARDLAYILRPVQGTQKPLPQIAS